MEDSKGPERKKEWELMTVLSWVTAPTSSIGQTQLVVNSQKDKSSREGNKQHFVYCEASDNDSKPITTDRL